MPQFDPANFLPQLAWLAAIFAVLYFVVVRPTLPKVGRVIDEREGVVSADLTAAETAKAEADTIRRRYDDGMATARAGAQASVAEARADSARTVEAQMKDLAGRLDASFENKNGPTSPQAPCRSSGRQRCAGRMSDGANEPWAHTSHALLPLGAISR